MPANTVTFPKNKKKEQRNLCSNVEAPPRLELGIKVLQTSALPLGYGAIGAVDEIRTRDIHLGKVALYH